MHNGTWLVFAEAREKVVDLIVAYGSWQWKLIVIVSNFQTGPLTEINGETRDSCCWLSQPLDLNGWICPYYVNTDVQQVSCDIVCDQVPGYFGFIYNVLSNMIGIKLNYEVNPCLSLYIFVNVMFKGRRVNLSQLDMT